MSDKSNVVPINLASKSADEKLKVSLVDEVTGEQIGTATLEGEMKYSRILKAGEDTYLMVDEANWEVAWNRFPWKMRARPFSTAAMKPRSLGMSTMTHDRLLSGRSYVVIEIGEHVFAVPERHMEELCRIFPQNL